MGGSVIQDCGGWQRMAPVCMKCLSSSPFLLLLLHGVVLSALHARLKVKSCLNFIFTHNAPSAPPVRTLTSLSHVLHWLLQPVGWLSILSSTILFFCVYVFFFLAEDIFKIFYQFTQLDFYWTYEVKYLSLGYNRNFKPKPISSVPFNPYTASLVKKHRKDFSWLINKLNVINAVILIREICNMWVKMQLAFGSKLFFKLILSEQHAFFLLWRKQSGTESLEWLWLGVSPKMPKIILLQTSLHTCQVMHTVKPYLWASPHDTPERDSHPPTGSLRRPLLTDLLFHQQLQPHTRCSETSDYISQIKQYPPPATPWQKDKSRRGTLNTIFHLHPPHPQIKMYPGRHTRKKCNISPSK